MKTNNKIILVACILLVSEVVSGGDIWVLKINGVINPVAFQYIHNNLKRASDENAECMIIEMDTPGGLMTSMRLIVKDILNSEIPVVVYISPRGAQAASAGVFITVAAHIAAMSPGTNIGAAHPVTIGGGFGERSDTLGADEMMLKITNDAVAYIRSIAHQRGRNEEWVEDAVRKSVSITEKEAVEKNVVDLVADNLGQLISKLDGMTVKLASEEKILNTENSSVIIKPMGFYHKLLNVISDPNIAYILLILGFYGLFFELSNPGAVLPGVLGGIFLVLAFFAFQILPINYAGIALIIIAIVLFILEIYITSYGLLTIGGIVSMILGSMMLIDVSEAPKDLFAVSLKVIIPVALFTAVFFIIALSLAYKAHRRKPVTGYGALVGEVGTAITDISGSGTAQVHGEYWTANSEVFIPKGSDVVVKAVDRMVLQVEKREK